MPKDVNSPVNSANKASKIGSRQPMSPGAQSRSNPSRGDQAEGKRPEPPQATVSLGADQPEVRITGPEDRR
jgi:hypothetical protein